jgi:hypothetical protein
MSDVSGAWLGTYWQEGLPTRFEATLVQGGNTLSGSILDDGSLGEAQISGEVIGRSIQFAKRYLTGSHALVRYSGTLSEDANFMQGTWNVGAFVGTWEAYRNDNDLMADLTNRLSQQIPTAVL